MKLTLVSNSAYSEYDDYEGDIINTPDFVMEMRLSVPNCDKRARPYITLIFGTQDEREDTDRYMVTVTLKLAKAILAASEIE